MKIPTITNKQKEILALLYKYRFLNRIQIQALLNHKDKKTINVWLRDLKDKQYVEWIYSTHFAEKTKPAVYYIGLNGVRWLKQQMYIDDKGAERHRYPLEEVRKRYRESGRSQAYVDRCVLLAGYCTSLLAKERNNPDLRYTLTTQTEYLDKKNEFNFLLDDNLESQLGPQLIITKREKHAKGDATTIFLVEVFDTNLPRYRVSKRLTQYVRFLTEGEWEAERDDDLPVILLVCPRLSELIYAKRRTRRLRKDLLDDERKNVDIRFATVDDLRQTGATGDIWECA